MDAKKIAYYAMLIACASLIISVNNYFRFGGVKDYQRMILQMEYHLETKTNLNNAMNQLKEAGSMSAEKSREEVEKRLTSAGQILGLAILTAETEDKKVISELKDEVGLMKEEEALKSAGFSKRLSELTSKVKEVTEKPLKRK
ncbi:MAG: hypothetical protein WC838_07245 [Candidatus Margulisiibacteriota bacterium]|jgi:hypothetical protein